MRKFLLGVLIGAAFAASILWFKFYKRQEPPRTAPIGGSQVNSDLLNWVNSLDSTNPAHDTQLRDCARAHALSDVGSFTQVRTRIRNRLSTLPMGAPAAWTPPGFPTPAPGAPEPAAAPPPPPPPGGPAAGPAPAAAVAPPVIPPMTHPAPGLAPAGYHWEVRPNFLGRHRYVLVSDTPPVARPPRTFPWDTIQFLMFWGGVIILALVAFLVLGPPFVDWVEDRIDEFRDEDPEFVTRVPNGNGDGNRNRGDTEDTSTDTDGTLTIGGLEINNDGKYHNGIKFGEIRPVPAGHIIVGDVTVNGNPPDGDETTGQIVVLFEDAMVIGTNGASIQPIGDNWQQAVTIKSTEMRLTGCKGGCARVDVFDQDGRRLDY